MISNQRGLLEILGRRSGVSAFRQILKVLKKYYFLVQLKLDTPDYLFLAFRGSYQGIDKGLFLKSGEEIYAILSFM